MSASIGLHMKLYPSTAMVRDGFAYQRFTTIRGAIVDDNQFQVRVTLLDDGANCTPHIPCMIERRDNYGNKSHGFSWS
ncbi:MAG: hypothetical protein ABS58_06305 [Mesorhizobium sp. SCN 65-20]|nr:MAG: hypothetical protein ABS58_06305 [Mesorhizobium sp. SCN 65-20]